MSSLWIPRAGGRSSPGRCALTVLVLLCMICCAEGRRAEQNPDILCTTTLIAGMVESLAAGDLAVHSLIPPGSCPGHFDLKPRDAMALSEAKVILRHDYQRYLDDKLSAQNRSLTIESLASVGHLSIPANYLHVLSQVRGVLARHYPHLKANLNLNYEAAVSQIKGVERHMQARAAGMGLGRTPVLASAMQAEFLTWLGLEVVGTFTDSPDELSVRRLRELVRIARRTGARAVVGNLQSDTERVARTIGQEIGLPVCMLSNFPGTNESNGTYAGLLLDNTNRLAHTLSTP